VSRPLMPRIGTARACGRADEPLGRSGVAWVNPSFGGDARDYAHWSAKSVDGTHHGNVGGVTLLASPLPGFDYNIDRWCGITSGEYRVEVPFDSFRQDDDKSDADAFVRWYRQREADRGAEVSRSRCSQPKEELLPWRSERDITLSQLKGTEVSQGRSLRLMAKADLYDHLYFKAPLPGIEAILMALTFRLDSLENAVQILDSSGTGSLGLMDFAGSLNLLGLDMQKITGMDDHSTFLALDRKQEGVVTLANFIRLRGALKVKPRNSLKSSQTTDEKPMEEPAEEPVLLEELCLLAPPQAPEVAKAMDKWCRIARWMSAASLRKVALRTTRLRQGWRLKEGVEDKLGAGDMFVAGVSSAPCLPSSPERPESASSNTSFGERPHRRRPATSTPKELTLESLEIMKEQEPSLRALFNTGASQKLPDGTPEMTREDLHLFFRDLELADLGRHACVDTPLLDQLYQEAVGLQSNFTGITSGLTFWSLKVVLNNIVPSLGLGWQRIIEATITPETSAQAYG